MSLAAGTRLGPYEVVSSIGAGGMGEVYKARDTRLNRDVAIKVLPESFAEDADRLRRFQLEAQSTGALNHPNILAIYDIGAFEGSPYLVAELLEGETLAERLRRGKLGAARAIDCARQITAGLAAAHAKGITHRDIKPDNLFITKDGRIKILDFGLAKQSSALAAGDKTATVTSTQTGVVMGTAAYMSPEQARGQAVDHRSDIFSFGCVLYEMLLGARAFRGDTSADLTGAILKDDPDLSAITPPGLQRIVAHCLEKSPEQRFQSASDIGFALEAITQQDSGPQRAAATRRTNWLVYPLAAALMACATLAYLHFRPAPDLKFHRLTFRRGKIHAARFAPDGHTIVYSAQWEDQPFQLFTVRDDSPESRPMELPGSGLFALSSTSQLAIGLNLRSVTTFVEEGTLAQAPFSGGAPRSLLNDVRFADWTPDGSQLAVVRETPKAWQIEFPPGQVLYQGPSSGYLSELRFSPDGVHLAFLEHPTVNSDGYVAMVDRRGQRKILTANYDGDAQGLAWSAKGDEVWFTAAKAGSRRELWAVNLSGRQRRIARYPVSLLLQDIARDGRVLLSSTLEDRSKILFRGPGDARERELSWLDYSVLRSISTDAKQITFDESGDGSPEVASYIRDTDGSAAIKLGPGQKPDLSPDGQWAVTVNGNSDGLIVYPVGAGDTKRIALKGFNIERAFWHPNGREILMNASDPGHGSRVFRVGLAGGAPRPITPEGVRFQITGAGADGKYVPGLMTSSGKQVLFPIDGGEPLEVKGALPKDSLAGWTADVNALYVYTRGEFPLRLYRLDFRTGRRDLIREIAPMDRAGVSAAGVVKVTPDGKAYAYSQTQALHELQLVEGLR